MKTSRETLFIDTLKSLGLNADLCEAINDMRKVVMEAENDVSDTTDAAETVDTESEDVVSGDDSDTKDEQNTEDSVVDTSKYKYQKPGFNVALLLKMKRLGTKEQLGSFLSRYANGDSLENYAKACAEKDKEFIDETYRDENEREEKKADIDLIVAEIVGKPVDKTDGIEKLKEEKEKLENDLIEAKGELEKLETDKRKLADAYKSMTGDEKEDASRKFAELNDKHDEQKNNIVGIYGKIFEINKRLKQLGWEEKDKSNDSNDENDLEKELSDIKPSDYSNVGDYVKAREDVRKKYIFPNGGKVTGDKGDTVPVDVPVNKDGSNISKIWNENVHHLFKDAGNFYVSVYEYIWKNLSADEDYIKTIENEKEQDESRENLREMLKDIMSEVNANIDTATEIVKHGKNYENTMDSLSSIYEYMSPEKPYVSMATSDASTNGENKPGTNELRGAKIQGYLDEIDRMSPEDFESQREEIEKRIRAREERRELERQRAAESGIDSPETTDSNEDAKAEKKPGRKKVQNRLTKPKPKPIRI